MRRSLALLPALALVAVAAGCGGGGYSTSTPSGGYRSAAPKSAPTSATATVGTANGGVGTMLVDGQGRSLYLWTGDKGARSSCSGQCAHDWPPVTTTSAPKASAGVKASLLATIKRADGTQQVTYAGHPLYRFAGDSRPGQVTGQGSNAFGASWWAVTPAGAAIERTA